MTTGVPANFASKIRHDESGCWTWTGARNSKGYPCWSIRTRAVLAHRVAWELLRGPIPTGLTIDHLCRNKLCVNPDHLEPVTNAENISRAYEQVRECEHGQQQTYRKGAVYGPECPQCRRQRDDISAGFVRLFDDLVRHIPADVTA